MKTYETSFQRISRVREKVLSGAADIHAFDRELVVPEQYKSRGIRALIYLAKRTEEIGEGIADISGLTERFTRNLISSGEKSDLALVVASAAGRAISGQFYFAGIAMHKVAGAALYATSSILSISALALINSGLAARRTPEEMVLAKKQSNFESSAYMVTAKKLLGIKENILGLILDKADNSSNNRGASIQKWVKYMSRQHRSVPPGMTSRRRANCNYIWQNLHQYGPVTRALMHIAYGTFQGVNKMFVSYDKHLGAAIGNLALGKKLGGVLGCRIGMTVSVSTAAALSVPLSPLVIGISTVGIMACGIAFTALLMAKLNVRLTNDWKGNIQRPPQNQVFGRVTPTWP